MSTISMRNGCAGFSAGQLEAGKGIVSMTQIRRRPAGLGQLSSVSGRFGQSRLGGLNWLPFDGRPGRCLWAAFAGRTFILPCVSRWTDGADTPGSAPQSDRRGLWDGGLREADVDPKVGI